MLYSDVRCTKQVAKNPGEVSLSDWSWSIGVGIILWSLQIEGRREVRERTPAPYSMKMFVPMTDPMEREEVGGWPCNRWKFLYHQFVVPNCAPNTRVI